MPNTEELLRRAVTEADEIRDYKRGRTVNNPAGGKNDSTGETDLNHKGQKCQWSQKRYSKKWKKS